MSIFFQDFFKNTIFVSSHMYPEKPEGTQVIVGSKNMGYISDTARNRTHNLFRPKWEPIPLGHSDRLSSKINQGYGQLQLFINTIQQGSTKCHQMTRQGKEQYVCRSKGLMNCKKSWHKQRNNIKLTLSIGLTAKSLNRYHCRTGSPDRKYSRLGLMWETTWLLPLASLTEATVAYNS